MIYAAQVALLIFTYILASKDADIYHLVRITDYAKDKDYIKSWHFKGAVLYALVSLIIAYVLFLKSGWFEALKVFPAALLIRVSLYDLVFNSGAGLDLKKIGTEARWDKYFSKLFGPNGAVKKAVIFFLILVALNVLNYAYR